MVEIRKIITTRETVLSKLGVAAMPPVVRRWHGGDPQPLRRTVRRRSAAVVRAGAMLGE